MPAIPLYQQQTSANQGFAGGSPTAADFGGQTAAAGQRIGAALESIGVAEHQALRIQQENTAKTWAGNAISKATLEWTQQVEDRKQKAEPGAPGFAPGVLADFDKYATETIDNAPDPLARRFVQQHLDSLRTQLGQHAIAFQAHQQVAYNVQLATNSIDNWAQVVQQDPSKYGAALQAIGETAPYPGALEAQKLNEHARLLLTSAAASSALDRDPYGLKDATGKAMGEGGFSGKTGVPWIDDASTDQVRQWNSAAQVKIHQLEAEKGREALAAERLGQKTFAAAADLDDKGQFFSPTFVAQLAHDTKGTIYEKDAADLLEQQKFTTGFASASAAQRQATLEQWRALGANPDLGTSPGGQKYLEKIERIQTAIISAQKENPWQAAGAYGQRGIDATTRVPQTPADAIGLIRLRAAQLPALETWTGKPESPLQPPEAYAFGEMLKRLPPDQQMPALSQIAAAVNDPERLDALAGQVSKGHPSLALALKFGGDQTNAGRYVGTLMLEGAQGLTDKTVKADDMKLSGWKAEIAGLVRGSIGDPKAESEIIDAAYLLRAGMELKGAAPGFSLEDTNRQAVKMLVGVPLEPGGVKTLLPRGMDEKDFDNKLRDYTPEKLAAMANAGRLAPGNIDLAHRPQVKNSDGSVSTVRSMGVNVDGKEVLIPTVSDDGRVMSDAEAIDSYRRTGKHLGIFASPAASTAYAKALHESQAAFYGGRGGSPEPQPVFYVRGNPISAQALSIGLLNYGVRRDGQGRYVPVRGNALVTLDKEGTQPLRLDVQ